MSHQVVWTKRVLDAFREEANLTDVEYEIMQTRIAGMTIQQQAFYFSMSPASVSRRIALLKQKYDAAQKHSTVLPPRKSSAIELYMDTH